MAYAKKTNTVVDETTKKTVTEENVQKVVEEVSNEKVKEVKKKTTETKTTENVKKFEQEDLIPCRSMVSGGLYIEGNRSHYLYSWADYGDVVDVEYRDLIYMVRSSRDKSIYDPRIIVEDEDFIAQNPKLEQLYASLYTNGDLKDILKLPIAQMKSALKDLPIGAKNAIKGIAATMIDDGILDSVKKVKALDEIFGTNMILTLLEQ